MASKRDLKRRIRELEDEMDRHMLAEHEIPGITTGTRLWPLEHPGSTAAPWYVGSCGMAHPWGVCNTACVGWRVVP